MTFLSNLFRRKSDPQKIEPLARRPIAKRTRANEESAQDPTLTEDPEKQRARHRLIGAATLVLIAVIGLPQILDKKPKPVANDITVQIVSSIPNPAAGILNPEPEKKVSLDSKPETKLDIKPEVKPTVVVPPTSSSSSSASSAPPAPSSNPASKGLGLAPGEELVVISKDVPASGEVRLLLMESLLFRLGRLHPKSGPMDGLQNSKRIRFRITWSCATMPREPNYLFCGPVPSLSEKQPSKQRSVLGH